MGKSNVQKDIKKTLSVSRQSIGKKVNNRKDTDFRLINLSLYETDILLIYLISALDTGYQQIWNHLHNNSNHYRSVELSSTNTLRSPNNCTIQSYDSMYIQNAGLVLYWVYLKKLFNRLGFLDQQENDFVIINICIRATLLLNTLAGNDTEKYVLYYELVLNKLLCDISIEQLIPDNLCIKIIERQELENLTDILISHWPALDKISTNGFRQTFIQRNDVIKELDNHWLLQIEKKFYDVLLNKLPWTVNIIKLPWMQRYLIVEC